MRRVSRPQTMIFRSAGNSARQPNLVWLGAALAAGYWLLESILHAYVFGEQPLAQTLAGMHDPNELWMRALVSLLLVSFGWIANRLFAAERSAHEDTRRLHRLLEFADTLRLRDPSVQGVTGRHAVPPDDLTLKQDDIASLTRLLWDLSRFLESRFNELYALLQLTHQINMGLLLDEVMDRAYASLRAILPYDRLGVALVDDDGELVRARWARTECPRVMLGPGYSARLEGSSLQGILASGEPRIIDDLPAHLRAHPGSESTRLMVEEGIRSSLTCPLVSSGRAIGFMFFSSRRVRAYERVHVEIFKLIAGHLSIVVEKSHLYQQILREKLHSESLLLNVIPERIADRLKAGEQPIADFLPATNIVFLDIVGFTGLASRFPPEAVLRLLQDVFLTLDELCDEHGVEKIKTVGDEYLAISGPAHSGRGGLRNLAEFALEALAAMAALRDPEGAPVRVRIGMHSGPVVAGVIGQKKFAYDVWGDAVNTASRMETYGEAGRIHVTREVYDELKDQYVFEERGEIDVKGKGPMSTYFLTGRRAPCGPRPASAAPPELQPHKLEAMREEHALTLDHLALLAQAIRAPRSAREAALPRYRALLRMLLGDLENTVENHFRFEEQHLFTVLCDAGHSGLAASLHAEHEDLREATRPLLGHLHHALVEDLSDEEWASFGKLTSALIDKHHAHMQREETEMLPVLAGVAQRVAAPA